MGGKPMVMGGKPMVMDGKPMVMDEKLVETRVKNKKIYILVY